MLREVPFDAAYVLVPPTEIFPVAATCLQNRIPIFIEKPAGMSSGETRQLAYLADSSNCLNMVGVNRRYSSVLQEALRVVQMNGDLKGILIEAPERIKQLHKGTKHPPQVIDRWLYANSVHSIDLIRHVCGEVAELDVKKIATYESLGDSFSASFLCNSGIIGSYVSHWLSPHKRGITLYAEDVCARVDAFTEKATVFFADGSSTTIEKSALDRKYKPGFYLQSRAFIDAQRYSETLTYPASDLSDAVKTMELIDQFAR